MRRPCLAAITFDPKGGGIASVSRLLRQVFQDEWGDKCRFFSLLPEDLSDRSLSSSTPTRIQFGTRIAAAQMGGVCSWMFYSHLSLARVQEFIPLPGRRPYAVFLHGIEVWRRLTRAEHRIMKGATLRIANSRLTARRVADAHPDVGPVVECPLALAPRPDSVSRSFLERDLPWIGPRAVVVVARMLASERYKGHDELLDAWHAVRADVPDAQLVFVGDGDDTDRLRARAADGLAQSVVFTGFVTERQREDLYRRAAVFAMPSRGEGFGMVYLEAMAHRLPCIGSIHDAASEVIEDGVTGYLVEQSDAVALAGRIVHLLRRDDVRLEMGAQGHRRLTQQFTYERFSQAILSHTAASFGAPARLRRGRR